MTSRARPSVQQAVHDRDDEYGPSQARGGEINTQTWIFEQGAACARSAVDIWGSAWATESERVPSVGRETGFKYRTVLTVHLQLVYSPSMYKLYTESSM